MRYNNRSGSCRKPHSYQSRQPPLSALRLREAEPLRRRLALRISSKAFACRFGTYRFSSQLLASKDRRETVGVLFSFRGVYARAAVTMEMRGHGEDRHR